MLHQLIVESVDLRRTHHGAETLLCLPTGFEQIADHSHVALQQSGLDVRGQSIHASIPLARHGPDDNPIRLEPKRNIVRTE